MDKLVTSRNPSQEMTMAQAIEFVLQKKFMDLCTMTLAQILAVNNDNTLTVKSLLNYKSVSGQPITPPSIFNVPQGAIQGGNAGFITEYQVGDNVLVGFIQRDITSLKTTSTQTTPQLNRMHNIADAFVICYWGSAPSIFVKCTSAGIEITAPNLPVNINAQTATITANEVDINSSNINLGSTGGVALLTTKSVINDSQGKPCIYQSNATTTVKAV